MGRLEGGFTYKMFEKSMVTGGGLMLMRGFEYSCEDTFANVPEGGVRIPTATCRTPRIYNSLRGGRSAKYLPELNLTEFWPFESRGDAVGYGNCFAASFCR